MSAPGLGRFFHHGWEVAADPDPLRARIASYHEFGHAALNSSTAWGGVIQQLAIARRFTGGGTTLRAAVAAAQQVHEAYATQVSISALAAEAPKVETFLEGQAGYARFLTTARKAGPAAEHAGAWAGEFDGTGSARMAALAVCMQSPAVVRLLQVGTERFELADVPARDWPDRRLRTLTALAPRLWAGMRPPPDDLFDHAFEAVAVALAEAGHPTVSRAEYGALLPELAADLNRLAADTGQEVELNLDGDTGVPGLFGSEAVRAREPLPATVGPPSEPVDVDGLTVRGALPHVWIVVRRMWALRAQYALHRDPDIPDDEPVTAVLTRTTRGDARLRLRLLRSPDDIDGCCHDRLTVTSVSLDVLRDRAWSARWLPALRDRTHVVGLFDVPPEAMIQAWLGTGEPLRVQLVVAADRAESALVFRLGTEEPVVLPVTPPARNALITYVERASGGSVELTDDLLVDVEDVVVRLALDHHLDDDAVRPLIVPAGPR